MEVVKLWLVTTDETRDGYTVLGAFLHEPSADEIKKLKQYHGYFGHENVYLTSAVK